MCSTVRASTTRHWSGFGEHSSGKRCPWAKTTQIRSPRAAASQSYFRNKGRSSRNMRRTFFLLFARSLWGGTIPALVIRSVLMGGWMLQTKPPFRISWSEICRFLSCSILVNSRSHFGRFLVLFWPFSLFFPPLSERVTMDWGGIGGKIEWK